MNPTDETYKTLVEAYEFFNKVFFMGKLPMCLITMQRKGKARGYFCPERFESRNKNSFTCHEIALNPALFKDRTNEEILSTLLHEMVHLWQQENGSAPKNAYHDKEWAQMMEQFGLMPSNTGEEGGRKTGHSMTHYIIPGGVYDVQIKVFLKDHKTELFEDRPETHIKRKASRNKKKYSCPTCGMNVWAKPGVHVLCGEDNVELVEA